MAIKTLDLHGIPHYKVEAKVEDFVLLSETPCRIITGNSPAMHSIVQDVLEKHHLRSFYENDYNLGSIIVIDKNKNPSAQG